MSPLSLTKVDEKLVYNTQFLPLLPPFQWQAVNVCYARKEISMLI